MPRWRWKQTRRRRWPPPRPLLPAGYRAVAIGFLAVCVLLAVFLGVWFAHQGHAGWPDAAVDARLQAGFAGQHWILNRFAQLGDPVPLITMTAALVLGCAAVRRWRAAVLVALAVPVAAGLTEFVLKPLIGRTLLGALSYPSGHATGVFTLAAAVAVLLADPVRPRIPAVVRLLLALAAFLAASAVAVSLVGLGAHYFTDAVGGASVGTSVALAAALVIDRLGSPPEPLPQPPAHPSLPARDRSGLRTGQ